MKITPMGTIFMKITPVKITPVGTMFCEQYPCGHYFFVNITPVGTVFCE